MALRFLLLPLFNVFSVLGHGSGEGPSSEAAHPMVVSTWPFVEAVDAAWRSVDGGSSAVDAVVEGCSACEVLRCDGTVGPGGSPDENGETTLDALVMDGTTMEVGAVAAMRYVKDGIKAANMVMKYTDHTLIVGEQASVFAISMGLPGPSNLSSPESIEKWVKWKQNSCQLNFRKNVLPVNGCGPYHPRHDASTVIENTCGPSGGYLSTAVYSGFCPINHKNHDTISMAAIDNFGCFTVWANSSRDIYKWCHIQDPWVGDGPIAGSSAYADDEVGACGATGDGDIMMRFLPCYQVVESMRQGMDPKHAAADAISRIARKFPNFVGAVFALNKKGVHAGACHGWAFQYSVRAEGMEDVQVFTVKPI